MTAGYASAERAAPEAPAASPLPRVLEPGEVNPVQAPVACNVPDGTTHPLPDLAAKGWQVRRGVWVCPADPRTADIEAG
jgi:hypothetical protein